MSILVTGANGMVGEAVKKKFDKIQVELTDIEDLDVRYWSDVKKYRKSYYSAILHLAAETNLEWCETEPPLAYICNHTGTMNMTLLAEQLDIPIIYISTAGIFKGNQEVYTDGDKPNPINHYGRSKYYGELTVRSYYKHYVFRAGWMMGGGENIDKKFVNKIYRQLRNGKKQIYALDDVYGSPTYTHDLIETIIGVIKEKELYGVYNCAGGGSCSRFDVAKEVVKCMGLGKNVEVLPVKSGYFKRDFFCPRSQSEVLVNGKLDNLKLNKMRHWKLALKDYMNEYFKL